jgi:hypothetical protein
MLHICRGIIIPACTRASDAVLALFLNVQVLLELLGLLCIHASVDIALFTSFRYI